MSTTATTTPATDERSTPKPGGFAQLEVELLAIWPYLPEHHLRALPMILSFMPESFPAQETVAGLLGVSRQTVNATVGQMADAGLFRVEHRTREGSNAQTSNLHHKTDWADPGVQQAIIAWYRCKYPKTPRAKRERKPAKQPGKKQSASARKSGAVRKSGAPGVAPVSTPVVDTPCQVLGLTPPVKPTGSHPLSTAGVSTNGQGNTQRSGQGNTQFSGLPAAGFAALTTASPAATPDLAGADDGFNAEGGRYDSTLAASSGYTASAEYDEEEAGEAGEPAFAEDLDDEPSTSVARPLAANASAAATAVVAAPASSDPVEPEDQRSNAAEPVPEPTVRAAKTSSHTEQEKAKPKGSGKAAKAKMTDEQKALACRSFEMMQRYVTFGEAGLDPVADVTKLRHAKGSPYKYAANDDLHLERWSLDEFVGFYWIEVAAWRAENGVSLALPNWGRLYKHMSDLLETKTREQLYRHLRITIDWFDVIKFMNGGAGRGFKLDESALSHSLVLSSVGALLGMTSEERDELWNKACEQQVAFQNIEREAA